MPDLTTVLRSERDALVTTLEQLSDEQWQAPSLCGGWRVVDVAAHLAWAPVLGPGAGLVAMARNRFSVNRMIARTAVAWSARGHGAILDQLRANAASGAKPIGMPQVAALADAVVHGVDVRRPLGLPHEVPTSALGPVADFALATPRPLDAVIGGSPRRRVRGLRIVVPGTDWSHGSGPEVSLPPEAALRLLYGRPVTPHEVSGPGAATLLARL